MKRLRALRNDRGITQEELGRAVGVGKTTISQYENGVRTPDAEMLGRLADYFGVTLDYLLGRSDDASPHPRPTKDPGLTIAAHRRGDFYEELPDEAKRQIDEYVEFIIQKYKKRKEEK